MKLYQVPNQSGFFFINDSNHKIYQIYLDIEFETPGFLFFNYLPKYSIPLGALIKHLNLEQKNSC